MTVGHEPDPKLICLFRTEPLAGHVGTDDSDRLPAARGSAGNRCLCSQFICWHNDRHIDERQAG